jgi:hypothetical protein
MKPEDGWVAIAVRDTYSHWETERKGPMNPKEARGQWDAGVIDMAQRRIGATGEFVLLVHARTSVDKRRMAMFTIPSDADTKSFRFPTRVRTVKGRE